MTTNLTTTNKTVTVPIVANQSLPSLSDLELLQAFKSPKIVALPLYDVGDKLNDALTKAYYHLGYKVPDEDELLKLQIYLATFIKSKPYYNNFSIDEIAVAIERGADRQYEEQFFGINPSTVTGWIKSYRLSKSRASAKLLEMEIDKSLKIEEKKEPTPEEQWSTFVTRVLVLYENFITRKFIMPTEASFCFNVLWRSHIIRFDEERRKYLKQSAFNWVRGDFDPMNAHTSEDRRKRVEVYDSLLEDGDDNQLVKNRAMALGLIDWFEELYITATPIETMLND